jgi:hypothetical protein
MTVNVVAVRRDGLTVTTQAEGCVEAGREVLRWVRGGFYTKDGFSVVLFGYPDDPHAKLEQYSVSEIRAMVEEEERIR